MLSATLSNSSYPLEFNLVLLAVRLYLGPMIFAHGFRKFFGGGKLAGTAKWFESIGMTHGMPNALMAASTEVGVGILLALGLLTPLASAGLISLMAVAILTVHRKNGFFIFNKGEGIEYTLGVAVMALVPATLGAGKYSLDNAWGLLKWSHAVGLGVALLVGLGGALVQLAVFYRPSKKG